MSLTKKVQTFRQSRKEQGGKEKKQPEKGCFLGVPYGIRTHDIQNHNLTL